METAISNHGVPCGVSTFLDLRTRPEHRIRTGDSVFVDRVTTYSIEADSWIDCSRPKQTPPPELMFFVIARMLCAS